MVEKIMLCEECGKLFRAKCTAELKCPGCNSSRVDSVYKHYNLAQAF